MLASYRKDSTMVSVSRRFGLLATLVLLMFSHSARAVCDWSRWDWLIDKCDNAVKAYDSGSNQLYLTGYARHGRGTYTAERIDELNEKAWGGGFGREVVDARNNSHEIYGVAFSDSHGKPQYMAGYNWLARWGLTENLRVGVGLTAFLALRSDYCGYLCPVPGILPLGAVQYRRVSVMASYLPKLPGAEGNGDVLFVFGKIALD